MGSRARNGEYNGINVMCMYINSECRDLTKVS